MLFFIHHTTFALLCFALLHWSDQIWSALVWFALLCFVWFLFSFVVYGGASDSHGASRWLAIVLSPFPFGLCLYTLWTAAYLLSRSLFACSALQLSALPLSRPLPLPSPPPPSP